MTHQEGQEPKPMRKSVIPESDEIRLPGGQVWRDPAEYNQPSPDQPTEIFESVEVAAATDDSPPASEPTLAVPATPPGGEPPVEPPAGQTGRSLPVWAWILIAVGGLLLVGVIVALVLNASSGEPVAAPSDSAYPSPTTSVSPSAPIASPFGLLDDGIADDEYPPVQSGREGAFPAAFEMEDWVWERVGARWSLVSYSLQNSVTVDLVSPEGAHFQVAQLPLPAGMRYAEIVSWHEDLRRVRVVGENDEYTLEGYLVDLEAGTWDAMSFTTATGRSIGEAPRAVAHDGTEIWTSLDSSWNEWLYRWTPSGGWARILPESDYYVGAPWPTGSVSPSGDALLLTIAGQDWSGRASSRSGPPGRPNFIHYDLVANTSQTIRPAYPAGGVQPWCDAAPWETDDVFRVICYGDVAHYYRTDLSGRWLGEGSSDATWTADGEPLSAPGSGLIFAGDREAWVLHDVSVSIDGERVSVLRAGSTMPADGVTYVTTRAVTDGVYRIDARNGSFLVDTENGVAATIGVQSGSVRVGVAGYGEPMLGGARYGTYG